MTAGEISTRYPFIYTRITILVNECNLNSYLKFLVRALRIRD